MILAGECSYCCIIGILALDFVLAEPWYNGLDMRYWFIRSQDMLDVQLLISDAPLKHFLDNFR
uniref:Uncharacterized protein n=1 Tax=Glossina palpalis gambiensis TaxID=67801 RepID=A0A1B0BP83_9MUSC